MKSKYSLEVLSSDTNDFKENSNRSLMEKYGENWKGNQFTVHKWWGSSIILSVFALLTSLMLLFGLAEASAKCWHPEDYSSENQISLKQIRPSQRVVSFDQITFNFEDEARIEHSGTDWGQFTVDAVQLENVIGVSSGYLNVFVPINGGVLNWVVENLFVPDLCAQKGEIQKHVHKSLQHYEDSRIGQKSWTKPFSEKSTKFEQSPISTYFDLRPATIGDGIVYHLFATVLVSKQPLPVRQEIFDLAEEFRPHRFRVTQLLDNAGGFLEDPADPLPDDFPYDAFPPQTSDVGRPPPPTFLPSTPPSDFDLSFPIEVFQADGPNIDQAKNQCAPAANANTIQYLESRYNILPLAYSVPDFHIPGLGEQRVLDASPSPILLNEWDPVPENSLVAHIDALTMRRFATDLESGKGSSICQLFRGLFGYLANRPGVIAGTEFRHQGGAFVTYGTDNKCDNGFLGGLVSNRDDSFAGGDGFPAEDGSNPTWRWIFDQLVRGRGVVIVFGRYNINGARTSGHVLRVWGAGHYNNRNYIWTLDDKIQGNNTSNATMPRTQWWEVADNNQPGITGIPNGRLELGKTNWEIEFAYSFEAIPTLLIP